MVHLVFHDLSCSDHLRCSDETTPSSKMKTFIVFAALVAVALAAAPDSQEAAKPEVMLVKEVPSDNIGLDSYKFSYELSDGQKRDESAQVETRRSADDKDESVLRVRGSFSFVNPTDGLTYTVTYVADENGFQPQGAHLPVAPVA